MLYCGDGKKNSVNMGDRFSLTKVPLYIIYNSYVKRVDRIILLYLLLKGFVKFLHPYLVEETEALAQETVEPQVGSLLAAALDQHVCNLTLHKDYIIITSSLISHQIIYTSMPSTRFFISL